MTQKEMYEKYIEEQCKNCLNKDKNLCDIRINIKGNAQCVFKKDK